MAVCVLGSINRDVVIRVAALPAPGETVAARSTMMLSGGKGANQSVAAARMGADVRLIGAVGADPDGADLVAALAKDGINVTAITRRGDAPTGTAWIALDDAGENQILVSAGANAGVTTAAAAAVRAQDRVCLAQLETPVAAVAAFFAAAADHGALRILNAAPAIPEGIDLLPLTDLLIVNETELARYLDVGAETIDATAAIAVRRLFHRPDQAAVVTLGAAGAVLVEADTATFVPARPAPVVDTTGAGDCFCGTLAAFLAEGLPLAAAAERAGIAASLCVGRVGAAPAMPWRREVDAIRLL